MSAHQYCQATFDNAPRCPIWIPQGNFTTQLLLLGPASVDLIALFFAKNASFMIQRFIWAQEYFPLLHLQALALKSD
jgi:hypothetical protein